jgi:hypothetical protein
MDIERKGQSEGEGERAVRQGESKGERGRREEGQYQQGLRRIVEPANKSTYDPPLAPLSLPRFLAPAAF